MRGTKCPLCHPKDVPATNYSTTHDYYGKGIISSTRDYILFSVRYFSTLQMSGKSSIVLAVQKGTGDM